MADRPKRILVVDDDPNLLVTVGDSLRLEGYDVVGEAHPKQALEWLETHRPDLVILDILMPELSGITFLKRMRANSAMADIPVLVFTARENLDSFFQDVDVDGFLPKSSDVQELLGEVRRILAVGDHEAERQEASPQARPRVLVAEEDQSMLEMLEHTFGEGGYDLVTAGNGPEAVQKAVESKPQVIVLNCILPHMNGDAVAAALCRIPSVRHIPVVLYNTSSLDTYTSRHLEKRTAVRKILHTCLPEDVLAAVDAVAHGRE
jgi:CheY-like chemotaxis protein